VTSFGVRTRQLRDSVRDWGLADTLEHGLCKISASLLKRGFRKSAVPSLETLCADARRVYSDPDDLLRTYCDIASAEIALLRHEYDELSSEISRRYRDRVLSYPRPWAVGEGSAFALYAIIRTVRPETVLETGVANGHSSFYILNALERNSRPGTLHSVDISSNVGVLIDSAEKSRWDLRILSRSSPKKEFLDVLSTLPSIDIMIHDSDHSYRWMELELDAAFPRMSESALFVCDDINLSFAWLDFCRRHTLDQTLLVDTIVDTIKVVGFAALREPFAELANNLEQDAHVLGTDTLSSG
jgi:predicted O-methyltransferase YrrM